MHELKSVSLWVLIVSLVVFTFLAVLSIWGVLGSDVAWKSLSTLGVIAFASLIALVVAKNLEDKGSNKQGPKA